LAADDKEGGRRLSLDEKGQDLGGGVRPGAVVKGQRYRQRPGLATGRVEGDRDHAAGQFPSVQDGLSRAGWKRSHRVAGLAGRKQLGQPGHGLDRALAGDNGDSVTTVEASACCCWLAVDQHPGWVSAFAEHAVVDRQQIPGRWDPKALQGLLGRQAGRQRPGAAFDHYSHRRPSYEQPAVGRGDQCGCQPEQQPRPAGRPQLGGRGGRSAVPAVGLVLGRARGRLQQRPP
jgi:hypothetical protein